MRLQRYLFLVGLTVTALSQGVPLVQSICNKSQIGFAIVSHSDTSACSFHNCGKIVDVAKDFNQEFLLERGKPSLVLRPIYFIDPVNQQKMELVDQDNQFDAQKVDQAYQVWKQSGGKRRFKNSQDWLFRWVGHDIEIKPHTMEVFGYLINLSRVKIHNAMSDHATWLSFSKGVFSRLILEVSILQHKRKGVLPRLKVVPGEGGICRNGLVERLF